jgi:O-acetyl-ADP-ribose deacetylase (regulator of RNase III)
MKPLFDNDVIVLPVNTSLVMGAGLAKEAARRYPKLGQLQSSLYWTLDFKPGTAQACCWKGKTFILAATKDNWRNPSQLAWVEGLCAKGQGIRQGQAGSIEDTLLDVEVGSIGIPALGCGLGGLSYAQVRPLVTDLATRLQDRGWDVTLYPPM